jgi:hypothetical protein
LSWCLQSLLAAGLSLSAFAGINANLSWTASADTNVTGYNIYYGRASHQYTNMVAVGNVTSAVVPNLVQNVTYFFAAKARNSAGAESDFSNEAAFAGVTATPNASLQLKTLAKNTNSHPLLFSLAAGSPTGATINPTNGTIYWTPGRANASTTNYITVNVTDTVDPTLNTSETFVIAITDYLDLQLGATAVYAGQPGSLLLTVASSSTLTNLQLTLAWPGGPLLNPTLNFVAPIISGSLQNQDNQIVIQLQTAANQPLTGTNQVAQVNFQAADGQSTAILNIPATAASGSTADGAAYGNVLTCAGEVTVVGPQPMLRPQAIAAGRCMSLLANPGTYELQYTTSLVDPVNWLPLMTYQQTNASQTVSLDAAEPVIFYRLQQL